MRWITTGTFILVLFCEFQYGNFQDMPNKEETLVDNSTKTIETADMTLDLYRRLLRQKRADQLSAIKQMMSIDSYDRQYKLVKLLLQKMSTVLGENKLKLLKVGYTPGDPFPTDENIKDALSMVVENTAFFGDVLLRQPDIVHEQLKANKEWDILVKWAVSYVNETKILVKSDLTLLNLMAQELEIVPKSPDYINPYKENIQKEKEKAKKELEDSMKKLAAKEKKKKKERHRGPRLQGGRNEL